jgi:serine/threonine protein kinase
LSREDLIYRHLGRHPQILQYFGLEEVHPGVHSLRLELAPHGNVRQFIEEHAIDPPPERVRLQMALDVATGLSYAHSRGIRHSDLSCRNLFLFEGYRVKIGDFGASMLDGHGFVETTSEESQYELPCRGRKFCDRPVMKRELFALGSAIYEVMAWARPFKGLDDEEVEARYAREEFPSLDGITTGPIVLACWKEAYETADEVVMSLKGHLM